MSFGIVSDLVTHSRLGGENTSILELGVKLALHAWKNMSLDRRNLNWVSCSVCDVSGNGGPTR
jgi:hypothetical protein